MIDLEDFHEDIIGKAMHGLGVGKSEMASLAGVKKTDLDFVLSGGVNEPVILAMARVLDLDGKKLLASARREWTQEPIQLNGLKQFNLPFGTMQVNAYVLWEEGSRKAWCFDTGPDAKQILGFIHANDLQLNAIFLTHTHRDHVACLNELRENTGNPTTFVHQLEKLNGCRAISEGFEFQGERLSLTSIHTHGHSIGGMTYLINGLDKPVAFVGDALFAGSMGGGMISYADALRTNREKIITLPNKTILCPGHGPMTTVEGEKKSNPFFPEF